MLDDNPLVRRMLLHVAARRDDVVLELAATPEEIRRRLRSRVRVDLIACDHDLAGVGTGVTSTPLVRELIREGHRVVVLIDDLRSAETDLAHEVTILQRPVSLDELLEHARRPR